MKISDKTRIAIKPDGTKIPVIDSKLNTAIQPNEDDIKNAVPEDPTRCMYAQACKRMFGSQLVWIMRTRAYVELKGKGGHPQLHRFVLRKPAIANIRNFDAGKSASAETIVFASPPKKERIEVMRENYKATKNKRKKTTQKIHPKDVPEKSSHAILPLRHSGTGLFQFKAY
jgi:hypothetical protein